MRILAFVAGLAGLVAVLGEIAVILIVLVFNQFANYMSLAAQITTWGQFAFITVMTVFLFIFALSKRPA